MKGTVGIPDNTLRRISGGEIETVQRWHKGLGLPGVNAQGRGAHASSTEVVRR